MKIILSPQVNNESNEELVITISNGQISCTPVDNFISDEPAGTFTFLMQIKSDSTEAECFPAPIELPDNYEGVVDYKSMLVSCKPLE